MKTFFICLFFCISFAFSAKYYIEPGKTGTSCSASAPCASFDQVFQLKLQNGDIIYLNEGTYSGAQNTLRDFPSSLSQISIQKAPGATTKPKIHLGSENQFFAAASRGSTNRFEVSIADLIFVNGHAPVGGVVDIQRDAGTFVFDRCEFQTSYASKGGVVHFGANNELAFNACLFSDNAASLGGALAGEGSIVNMTATNFTLNHAENNGGGIFLEGEVFLQGSDIFAESNIAMNGGFIYGNLDNVVFLNHTIIHNCTADNDGGAFWGYQSVFDIIDGDISKCSAAGKGGVARIFAEGSGLRCDGCTISNNSALVEGGAFDMQQQATLYLSNSIISQNKVVGSGGAIAILTEAKANISSVVASNNIAKNGGFMRSYYRAKVWLIDTTLSDNHANLSGAAISCSDSTLYFYGDTTFSKNTLTPGEKNATSDPDLYCDDIPQGTKCRTIGDDKNHKWDGVCPDPNAQSGPKDYSSLMKYSVIVAVIGVVCCIVCCISLAIAHRYQKKQKNPEALGSEYSFRSLNDDPNIEESTHLDD